MKKPSSSSTTREAEALRGSTVQRRDMRMAMDATNVALERLLNKQTNFIRQLERFLTDAEKKREQLTREKARILNSTVSVRS